MTTFDVIITIITDIDVSLVIYDKIRGGNIIVNKEFTGLFVL